MTDRTSSAQTASSPAKTPGLTIAQKLVVSFLGFFLVLGALLVVVYRYYVPPLVIDQVGLRVESVAKLFAAASLKPVVEQDYLLINKLAEQTAALPDVAYAAAVNSRGIAVAGIFGKVDKFDADFVALVEQRGFPTEIVKETALAADRDSARRTIMVGGREIMDYAMRLPQTGAVVHVGLFTDEVRAAERATLVPLLILLGAMALAGAINLILVARTVSRPIRELSKQAENISLGQLSDEISIKAGGEVWELAESFKRMQASIRYAASQMRRQKQQRQ